MITRRTFLKYTGGTTLTLFATGVGGLRKAIAAAIPGGTLDLEALPKFGTPLLIPPVMPRAGVWRLKDGRAADYYEISMRQISQQILPAGYPRTTVWGYGAIAGQRGQGLLLHNAPSLTIEARWNQPTVVKWVNELVDASGNYLPHLLPVDPTLHWANPPGGLDGRDMRPGFSGKTYVSPDAFTDPATQYTRYPGPVPIVTHVHGMESVGDESDGYAEAWYLPVAGNIPAGYATTGTWYDFFKAKAANSYGANWGPGFATFRYPNTQRASTVWYHDHTLGMTRLNVYAGPAGFYIIRGGPAGDAAVRDSRTGLAAVLPGPAPRENDAFLKARKTYYEIPIAIQDRSFNADGSLFYPNTRDFFDGVPGPYLPDTDISPIWNPEFFGNVMMVNGNTWPFLNVEQRRYRFRFLNGCDSRFLILDFSGIPGVEVWQIGNEGGFLAAPVDHTTIGGNKLLMGPAERADVIVDFTNVPAGNYALGNVGPDEPFGGGEPTRDFEAADPTTTGQVMQFRVRPALAADPTTPPRFLVLPPIVPLTGGAARPLALLEEMSMNFTDAPAETRLGTVSVDAATGIGTWQSLAWEDHVTENPAVGATEVWEFYNATGDAHPMHVHEVFFQVVDRQDIFVDETSTSVQVVPGSAPVPPQPWESGWKDTVIAYPGQVTRVRMQFKSPGQFVWHCHIVEHEDNEMMRPYRVGPLQPGQPMPHGHGGMANAQDDPQETTDRSA